MQRGRRESCPCQVEYEGRKRFAAEIQVLTPPLKSALNHSNTECESQDYPLDPQTQSPKRMSAFTVVPESNVTEVDFFSKWAISYPLASPSSFV